MLEPVRAGKGLSVAGSWTEYLVLFLRLMAAVSLVKGLYHWAQVCGIGAAPDDGFLAHTVAWQSATVFFAVLDLVAAVGLWLAAAWGAVVWLSSVVSMAVVEVFFPNVFGGSIFIVLRRDDAARRLSVARDRVGARAAGVRTDDRGQTTDDRSRSRRSALHSPASVVRRPSSVLRLA